MLRMPSVDVFLSAARASGEQKRKKSRSAAQWACKVGGFFYGSAPALGHLVEVGYLTARQVVEISTRED
jgi:hypothetical protein